MAAGGVNNLDTTLSKGTHVTGRHVDNQLFLLSAPLQTIGIGKEERMTEISKGNKVQGITSGMGEFLSEPSAFCPEKGVMRVFLVQELVSHLSHSLGSVEKAAIVESHSDVANRQGKIRLEIERALRVGQDHLANL